MNYKSINLNNEIKATEKWQEILRTGDFSKGRAGVKFNKIALAKVLENFQKNVIDSGMLTPEGYSELPVNIDHLFGGAERDAAGWITNLKIENNERKGQSLYAKIRWTELGTEKVSKELFRGFSVEIHTKDQPYLNSETGEKTPFVLTGLALTNEPFISGMKAAELNAKTESTINNFLNNMETVKTLLSSLAGKDQISRAELELLSTAVSTLDDEGQEEIKEEVEAVEKKVEETEAAQEAEATEKEEVEAEALKAKAEAEKLSKLTKDKDVELLKLSTDLSEAHSKIDKLNAERRAEKTQAIVEKLSDDAKIVGEKIVEKTVTMLLSKSEKDADEMIDFLSSQPARITTGEIGSGSEAEKAELSATEIVAQATKLKADGDTRELPELIESLRV